jgi:hypothetical protein
MDETPFSSPRLKLALEVQVEFCNLLNSDSQDPLILFCSSCCQILIIFTIQDILEIHVINLITNRTV